MIDINKIIVEKIAEHQQEAPPELEVLITVVNRDKGELFNAFLQDYEVNASLLFSANGTLKESVLSRMGMGTSKTVIMTVIKKERSKEALEYLAEKFKTVKNGKGIAFTVPFSAIIGLSAYSFLSNQPMEAQ